MGCDIHVYCEQKETINGNKIWICADHFKINKYAYYDDEDSKYEPKYHIVPIYDDRDYCLFETLAGVRAYYGNEIMDEPRGLPDDVSDTVKAESDRWDSDGHSHSWFTARELFKWQNLHPTIHNSGLVSKEAYEKYQKDGALPTSWWQGSNNPTDVRMEWDVPGCPLDRLIDGVKKRMAEVFWIFDWMEESEKKEKYWKHADDFRIVFWFDN